MTEVNKIARRIQIDLITDKPNAVVIWFDHVWNNLNIIEMSVFHEDGGEIIYYDDNKNVIFFRDDNNHRFWCDTKLYWIDMSNRYQMSYTDISYVTKILVENNLNATIAIPTLVYSTDWNAITNTLNQRFFI